MPDDDRRSDWLDDFCVYRMVMKDDRPEPGSPAQESPGCGCLFAALMFVLLLLLLAR